MVFLGIGLGAEFPNHLPVDGHRPFEDHLLRLPARSYPRRRYNLLQSFHFLYSLKSFSGFQIKQATQNFIGMAGKPRRRFSSLITASSDRSEGSRAPQGRRFLTFCHGCSKTSERRPEERGTGGVLVMYVEEAERRERTL